MCPLGRSKVTIETHELWSIKSFTVFKYCLIIKLTALTLVGLISYWLYTIFNLRLKIQFLIEL